MPISGRLVPNLGRINTPLHRDWRTSTQGSSAERGVFQGPPGLACAQPESVHSIGATSDEPIPRKRFEYACGRSRRATGGMFEKRSCVLRCGSEAGMRGIGTAVERATVTESAPSQSPRASGAVGTSRRRTNHRAGSATCARRNTRPASSRSSARSVTDAFSPAPSSPLSPDSPRTLVRGIDTRVRHRTVRAAVRRTRSKRATVVVALPGTLAGTQSLHCVCRGTRPVRSNRLRSVSGPGVRAEYRRRLLHDAQATRWLASAPKCARRSGRVLCGTTPPWPRRGTSRPAPGRACDGGREARRRAPAHVEHPAGRNAGCAGADWRRWGIWETPSGRYVGGGGGGGRAEQQNPRNNNGLREHPAWWSVAPTGSFDSR